jgi:hypothetical protein
LGVQLVHVLGKDYSILFQEYLQYVIQLLPWAISPIHAQPTCMYVCRNPRVARNTYILYSTVLIFPRVSPTHTRPGIHVLEETRMPAFLARRTRPIGREQLRDPLLQRRAVKGSEVASFPQFCLDAFTGGRRSFFGATHSTIKSSTGSGLFGSSFRVWLPHVSACADCPAS